MEKIVNAVHTYRSKKNVTQEEFAKAIGVSRQTVIALEKGNYAPSVLLALKIAKYFGVSVEDLFKISV
jgi:putative transcriptional regulator